MKNPLSKRYLRELKSEWGKYLALFLFFTIIIGFCSGFLVADGSCKSAYDNSFEKYNIENGHFVLTDSISDGLKEELEEKEDITIYPMFYKDKEIAKEHTIRLYKMRDDVNKADLMDGEYPKADDEIVIDRLYAENNEIAIGDTMKIEGKKYKVTGGVALSDYSALFKNNTDMMFDANKFTVALVTEHAFDKFGDAGLKKCYAWVNDDVALSDKEQEDKANDIKDIIKKKAVMTDFVARQDNQAITFTGDDMGGDQVMVQWLLYIVIVILAFIFAITARSTIEQESSVVGTLLASGYTRGELVRHYMTLPVVVMLVASVVGNVLGYTWMKYVVAGMYYHSYSLPTYTTIWNADAFIETTVIPFVLLLVVNFLVIMSMMTLPPLQFLRHELKRNKKRRAISLPNWKFITRFRIRVILQNKAAYLTLFAGIFFASVLMLFGMMLSPLLTHFKAEVLDSKIANYQYILKMPLETETSGAEKYAVSELKNSSDEEITVYGIEDHSKYLKNLDLKDGEVVLSDGYMEKYGIQIGDEIKLHEEYGDNKYTFKVSGRYHYPATMCIFLSKSTFCDIFDKDPDYFSGYFTDKKIEDIDDTMIASTITEHDLTVMADQLEDSMGQIFSMMNGFALMIYIIVIYLLAKTIIEKNAASISMLKILGYSDREAGNLYSLATGVVVAVSLIIAIPLSDKAIKVIYYLMMKDYSGWLTYYIAPWIYPTMFVLGMLCYLVVYIIQSKKIRKIPLSQALKNVE